MYTVERNGKEILESDACGIGLVASRKGVADRRVVELGLKLTEEFDHRGAPGHGAGVQIEIPWALLIDRFPRHLRVLAQRDVALGMFFMPFDASERTECHERVEALAHLAGADVLQWSDVPVDPRALPPGSPALRTLPVVRMALFKRPEGMSEAGWFACRYLLRLAVDRNMSPTFGDRFSLVSLSNRTVIYKGLGELSKISQLYPDLQDDCVASRYMLFHSRYCTNTSTAWKRAQPFWALAHNGEITTIRGNVAWMEAIGKDLLEKLRTEPPQLLPLAENLTSVICSGGSDSANLDDMMIALMAGGMTLPQSILALMPESRQGRKAHAGIEAFSKKMSIHLGGCDGPAAIVACDGDDAVAHLDRNGLRPLWVWADDEMVFAGSELTKTISAMTPKVQRCLGPGDTFVLRLANGQMSFDDECANLIAISEREVPDYAELGEGPVAEVDGLDRQQVAFGMTKEDLEVVLGPLIGTGKPAIGSMGDDTPPAALLDRLPRRLEDHFSMRFAQETSPAIDPIRDEWVFDTTGWLGDRGGLWGEAGKGLFRLPNRILSRAQLSFLADQQGVGGLSLLAPVGEDVETAIERILAEGVELAAHRSVLVVTDRQPDDTHYAVPALRVVSRLHALLARSGKRQRVGLVAEAGVWDIHHVALLISLGADAVQPWLGSATAGENEPTYLKGLRAGFLEVMSMVGVTPSSAYCGAALVEAVGLDPKFVAKEFPNVPCHLGGIGPDVLNREWLSFHEEAFAKAAVLVDAGEFRHTKEGRPHANDAGLIRNLHAASGYAKKIHGGGAPGSYEAYQAYAGLVRGRNPITVLDCIGLKLGDSIPLEEVEPIHRIAWRFMSPGMSEGALSEPAHRAVARAFNVLDRYCRMVAKALGEEVPFGVGPIANSGEGGFDKARIGTRWGNRSVQYAGGRFTITPWIAATAGESEVKFAQGAKPGKGGQLPGKKVSSLVAQRRGCEPGYELVSPPINHNLYSIEDVKLMLESWRTVNPTQGCALKFVATHGVEMVAVGGANAGATRLHLSDGCGGTGAAKRVDQKHAGIPVAAVLPKVHDYLIEEGLRGQVELSVDGGVQAGEQFLKLVLLGADKVGFGTSVLVAIGCSMLRKCHLAGPDPNDPTGQRRLGCAPGVATQDPVLVGKFQGRSKHIVRYLLHVATEVRELMAEAGIQNLAEVVGRRALLDRKPGLTGKAALLQVDGLLGVPPSDCIERSLPKVDRLDRSLENAHAARAILGEHVIEPLMLTHDNRCLGVAAAGEIARAFGDLGLAEGSLTYQHQGAAGHFYAAYAVDGMRFELTGVAADSCFTAAYGGTLIMRPQPGVSGATLVGNTFGYGARGGRVYIAGRAGNRFGICLRKNHEGGGARIVVEGLEANGFQYMTGGTALVLGSTGRNLGAGMTGGQLFLLDYEASTLNTAYVKAEPLREEDVALVQELLREHVEHTGSTLGTCLLKSFDPNRFVRVTTCVVPEKVE